MDFRIPDYRAQAEKCLELSERADDSETRLHWMMMAKACTELADELEINELQEMWAGPIYPNYPLSQTRH